MARPIGNKNIKWDKVELERLYWEEKMSGTKIARLLCVGQESVNATLRRLNIPRRNMRDCHSRELHYRWQGGRYITSNGYVMMYVSGHPRSNKAGYIPEHIFVWEKYNGKRLRKGEIVHHLNGIKADNQPLNLLAMMKSTHDKLIPALRKRIVELEQELNRCRQSVMELKI